MPVQLPAPPPALVKIVRDTPALAPFVSSGARIILRRTPAGNYKFQGACWDDGAGFTEMVQVPAGFDGWTCFVPDLTQPEGIRMYNDVRFLRFPLSVKDLSHFPSKHGMDILVNPYYK